MLTPPFFHRAGRALAFSLMAATAACGTAPAPSPQATRPPDAAGHFSFGLWGDMPYAKAGDPAKMPALLASLNAAPIAFSIYDGDIKDGSSRCTDAVFTDALTLFNQLRQPAVYLPGDNEWTDCHRLNNGGYDTLERLAALRRQMFPTLNSLGQRTMPLEHQGALGQPGVENVRFVHQGIVFAGFNLPGSNNNLVASPSDCQDRRSARTPAQCAAGNAEYELRDQANRQWLHEAFERARQWHAPGLVLAFQADPGFDLPETEADESLLPEYSGYRRFLAALVDETEQFAGQVLLVHGDTHYFKLDMPLRRAHGPAAGSLLTNLTRLETFGSPHIHWVQVHVDPASPRVFSIEPVLVN